METLSLVPYVRLPRAYAQREILHSTVDTFGRAHWLLGDRPARAPYDALVVTVDDGQVQETHLSAVTARHPMLDALPDGGFVVADARRRGDADHVQVFGALGRHSWSFAVGDALEHLLTDESGDLWVGYFDEGVFGGDPLSEPGLRRWSSSGEALWEMKPASGIEYVADCYALNVDKGTAWACPYTEWPLLEIRENGSVTVRSTPVAGARALAVHGGGAALFGGYEDDVDRLVLCTLTGTAAEPYATTTLVRPDGTAVGRRRVVGRGPRIYVQPEPCTAWEVWDLSMLGREALVGMALA
ncbi:hypothetical protein ABZ070_13410 [Streptomyces sp. NPDC006283]|uniref:hypothetical protein n=1 Tax=Streptomyces sp. NPDC006283 TaxID=3156741 RepID=UPI00339F705C